MASNDSAFIFSERSLLSISLCSVLICTGISPGIPVSVLSFIVLTEEKNEEQID